MAAPEIYIADNRLVFDTKRRRLHADGKFIKSLLPKEYAVLEQYAQSPDFTLSQKDVGEKVWGGFNVDIARRVEVALSQGRKKIGSELGNKKSGAFRTRYKFGTMALSHLANGLPWPAQGEILSTEDGLVQIHEGAKLLKYKCEIREDLPYSAFMAARTLVAHQGEIVTAQQIAEAADMTDERTVSYVMRNLQHKLGTTASDLICSYPGRGYVLQPSGQPS